jgi:hypothetical protein
VLVDASARGRRARKTRSQGAELVSFPESPWPAIFEERLGFALARRHVRVHRRIEPAIAKEFEGKKKREAAQRIAKRRDNQISSDVELQLTNHPEYFSLQDIRPTAITAKLENRDDDAYDFAAHTNPGTMHRHYDRRKTKAARATE